MLSRKETLIWSAAVAIIFGGGVAVGRKTSSPQADAFCREQGYMPPDLKTTKTGHKTVDFPGGQVEVEIEVEAVRIP